jgi:drug/metabolite transporter (DMT)-like permease
VLWIVPALLAPLLWAASNLVDDHLVKKATLSPFMLVLSTGIFASLPALFVAATGRWGSCDGRTAALALVGGALGVLVYYPYFRALELAPPSAVMLMWNLSPVLIAGIAHATTHEHLSKIESLSLLLLVASSAIATTATSRSWSPAGALPWMLIASVFLAVSSVIEKATYERLAFWPGFGRLSLGAAVAAALVTVLSPLARTQLCETYRSNLAALMFGNELLDLAAVGALNLATSMAPVSLVHAVGGTQPVFILLLARFLPSSEVAGRNEWIRTILAAALALTGLSFLRPG